MSKDKKRLVPVRRFKEFENSAAWEQRKVIDLLNQPITDGPHETPNLVEKGIPFISADAIVDNRIDFSRKRGFITKEYDLQCRKKYSPELYDVYLVKSGSTVGKVAIVETTKQFNIWSPLAAMRCKGKTNPYFLYFLFQIKENQNQVKSKASNGTQPNLSMREIEQFNVQIPSLHDEQKKIGEFFKQLNSLITLHQRKLDKLKRVKSAYLTEMFPAEGEREPKRRFPGFTGAWEQRKLGEVAKIVGGGTPSTKVKEYWDGDINWYSPVEIGNSIYASGSVKRITELGLEKSSAKILPKGTVLFTSRAGIGNTAILSKEAATNQGFQSIVPKKKLLDSYFIFTETPFLKKYGEINGAGSTFVEVSGKQMAKMPLRLPLLEEQKKIGVFFKQIDSLIALHQRKLDKLKKMKEAYLNEMFV